MVPQLGLRSRVGIARKTELPAAYTAGWFLPPCGKSATHRWIVRPTSPPGSKNPCLQCGLTRSMVLETSGSQRHRLRCL